MTIHFWSKRLFPTELQWPSKLLPLNLEGGELWSDNTLLLCFFLLQHDFYIKAPNFKTRSVFQWQTYNEKQAFWCLCIKLWTFNSLLWVPFLLGGGRGRRIFLNFWVIKNIYIYLLIIFWLLLRLFWLLNDYLIQLLACGGRSVLLLDMAFYPLPSMLQLKLTGQSCAVFSTGPIVFLDSLKEKQIWHEQKALEIFLKV